MILTQDENANAKDTARALNPQDSRDGDYHANTGRVMTHRERRAATLLTVGVNVQEVRGDAVTVSVEQLDVVRLERLKA
jgi:hypothetical protein